MRPLPTDCGEIIEDSILTQKMTVSRFVPSFEDGGRRQEPENQPTMVKQPDNELPKKIDIIRRLREIEAISISEMMVLLSENGSRYALPFSTQDFSRLQLSMKPETEIFQIIREKYNYLLKDFTWGQIQEMTKVILEILK